MPVLRACLIKSVKFKNKCSVEGPRKKKKGGGVPEGQSCGALAPGQQEVALHSDGRLLEGVKAPDWPLARINSHPWPCRRMAAGAAATLTPGHRHWPLHPEE